VRSSSHPLRAGIPQGSILGPILFTYYLRDMPTPPRTLMALYADDTALLCESRRQHQAATYLQRAIDMLLPFLTRKHLHINAAKTQTMMFNRGSRLTNATEITVEGTPCRWLRALTYLGVTLDPGLHFHTHTRMTQEKATTASRQLYALISRRSPLFPEVKLLLFKTCIRPILTYAAPIITPYLSKTSWKVLQVFQNKIIKAAIGKG